MFLASRRRASPSHSGSASFEAREIVVIICSQWIFGWIGDFGDVLFRVGLPLRRDHRGLLIWLDDGYQAGGKHPRTAQDCTPESALASGNKWDVNTQGAKEWVVLDEVPMSSLHRMKETGLNRCAGDSDITLPVGSSIRLFPARSRIASFPKVPCSHWIVSGCVIPNCGNNRFVKGPASAAGGTGNLQRQRKPARARWKRHGGSFPPVLDAENRPITAGGFVKTGPIVFEDVRRRPA